MKTITYQPFQNALLSKARTALLLISFLLFSFSAIAQVKFEAKLSKQKLGINERLRVDFEMNEDGDNFIAPNFEGFRVVMGPNQSVSHQWINGKRTFSKTYSYFLSPTARGKFTIGQATVEIKGQTYKTSPIEVEVTAAVDTNQNDGIDHSATEGIHLVAEVSKTNPYLNEGITVTYKLYVAPETSVSSWREMDSPKFADFWSQNIDNREFKVYDGTYQGKPYRYVILRSTVLYPQKTGKLEIEPLSLDVSVDVRTNRRDMFGRPFMTRVNRTVSAGKVVVDVKPLPETGKPVDFSGAVGTFSFNVKSNKTELDASESIDLTVEVTGNGNLKLFSLPKPVVPNSFELYEPEFRDRVTTNESGMRGSISQSYAVIPQNKGSYTIRPLSFSYFDLKTESYKTITSAEIPIEVKSGPMLASGTSESSGVTRQAINLSEDQFKYIKLRANFRNINSSSFFNSSLFWSLLISPLLLIPILILLIKKRKAFESDVAGQKLRRANRLAKKYLSEAKKNKNSQKLFYEALERALHNYLKAKLNIETTEFSKDKIMSLLQERNVEVHVCEQFIQLLKSCEFARYTPASEGAIQQDYGKAVEVIATIDKQIS